MTAAVHPLPLPDPTPLLAMLIETVRPEFQQKLIRIDPDDPVFARGRCAVEGCERGGWARQLCGSHYNRWRSGGRPSMAEFCAASGPITPRASSLRVDAFDLRRLELQLRLEVAYSIQCRHDDRAVRLMPEMIRQFVELLAAGEVTSLLDRPVDDWVAEAITTGRAGGGSRTIGQLRYTYRRLRDLVEGTDAESEFARDTWRAAVLGLDVVRPPRQVSFDQIPQPWLRTVAKRYARFRLSSGKKFGTVYIDVRAIRYFATFLADQRPDIADETGLDREVIEHYISWLATSHLAGYPINTYLVTLRSFLETCRR